MVVQTRIWWETFSVFTGITSSSLEKNSAHCCALNTNIIMFKSDCHFKKEIKC